MFFQYMLQYPAHIQVIINDKKHVILVFHGMLSIKGQFHGEGTSIYIIANHLDRSEVLFYDRIANGKPQPCSFTYRRSCIKRVEYLVNIAFGNSMTRIGNSNQYLAAECL